MIRFFLAAMLLSLSVATARAQITFDPTSDSTPTYYYQTSNQTPQAPGTNQYSDGGPQGGGLCSPGTTACPAYSLIDGPLVSGTGTGNGTGPGVDSNNGATSGLITFTLPSSGFGLGADQYFLMTISVDANTNNTRTGDIFDVTLCNGGSSTCGDSSAHFSELGTTSVVLPSPPASPSLGMCLGDTSSICPNGLDAGLSAGAFPVDASPGSTYTVGITDLLEQYIGGADTLPGQLGQPGLDGGTGLNATVSGAYDNTILQFSVSITPAPEPASLALLGGAATLLGAMRWSRRSQRARGPARQG
jgi:hypothetical protein